MRTVILGNGIVGLSIAFRLTTRGAPGDEIVIVGRQDRPGSATLAAAAMLNSFAEIEAGGLDHEIDLYRFELSHLATQMWPKFERELIDAAGNSLPKACGACSGCVGGGCFAAGTYVVNNTSADDLDDENFEAIRGALEDFNEPFEFVSPREIPNYHPAQPHRATRALLIHNEGWFNPRVMIQKLEAVLRRDPGVRFIDNEVSVLSPSGAEIAAAVLESGELLSADNFVLATGAASTDVLARSALGLDVQRVFYGVGVSLEIRSPDFPHTKCIRTPNRGLACGLYSVPYFQGPNEPNDHVLIGASNFISPVPYHHGRLTSVESLMKGAMEQINTHFYRADLVRVNVGWRPTSQDTYPLFGRTSFPNLLIATGTKRDGFHLAPLIADRMVEILKGEPVEARFDWFSPERKPIRTLTREQAIAKALRHQMSAAYQHGFTPSMSRMPDQVRQMYKDGLERLHDQVGAFEWGIPPEMLDMYRYGHALP